MELQSRLQEVLGDAFAIERELGGGGMSSVFLAHERAFDRRVVVKVLAEHLAAGMNVERFKREILVAAGLQHPHIVGVLTAGEVDGLPYFIMPYVAGDSLRARLELGPISPRETVDILKDVARGLGYAHGRGIVHRDVKPDNVLLAGGAAAITDFGVAKAVGSARDGGEHGALTQAGTSLGTPAYMAPEQAAGQDDVDHRADIYALGVTAYEMLRGTPPFHNRSFARIIAAHIAEPPPPLEGEDLPAALADLVMRCLAKEPGDRPQTAAELLTALDDPHVLSGAAWVSGAPPPHRLRVGVGAAAVALAAFAGFWYARDAGDATSSSESVAVLPFVNVSGDTADAYFADGVTDELISALQRVEGLRVASRTAVFSFKGSTAPVDAIGEALGVTTLLEGTIRRGGEILRVTAQLVNVRDGLSVWSQTFETGMGDVFAVQDSIAGAIVAAMRERLGAPTMSVATTRGTTDLEAYDLYLRGRFFFAQRGEAHLRRAAEFFREAIARDPNYAAAHTGLADALGLLPLYAGIPSDSILPAALAAADRAITLDSSLAVAYASRAALLGASWRWTAAVSDFQRALELDPEYATAHQWYGELLALMGRGREAAESLARAAELDPLSPVIAASYAGTLAQIGDPEARPQGRRAVELGPSVVTHMLVGHSLLVLGDRDDAIVQLQAAVALAGSSLPQPRSLLAFAEIAAGNEATGRAHLDTLLARRSDFGYQVQIARVYVALGRLDSALTWLERGVDARDPFFQSEGLGSSLWDPLRAQPRFRAVVERVGFDSDLLAH